MFNFNVKGKPESSAVNRVYRDNRGAILTYEKGVSEWAYGYDTVAFLDPREYIDDSLIRTVTDRRLKEFLKGRMGEYAFVNFEKTMVQPKSPGGNRASKSRPTISAATCASWAGGMYSARISRSASGLAAPMP